MIAAGAGEVFVEETARIGDGGPLEGEKGDSLSGFHTVSYMF